MLQKTAKNLRDQGFSHVAGTLGVKWGKVADKLNTDTVWGMDYNSWCAFMLNFTSSH